MAWKREKASRPKRGVISVVEGSHVEEQLFGPVILRRAEYYIKFDFPQTSCFLIGDDASKGGIALLDACPVNMHFAR
mgnify:CR=1 FL=1